ncbi:Uu.00g075050.m01.CDS01 [Anthostomella pinea]|uniref:Uu.00g075050.m01.CDS01 n=1 Tax=Anthostomella pinea TaxID=933095 RepID=A0AAI8VWH3_9PEZI|nr:Uu.00g075050.m01.CDS01 [Anthostomella pinea]
MAVTTTSTTPESHLSQPDFSFDWERCVADLPADLFQPVVGSVLPPTDDWLYGLQGSTSTNGLEWSLPDLGAPLDAPIFGSTLPTGNLHATTYDTTFLSNQISDFNMPPEASQFNASAPSPSPSLGQDQRTGSKRRSSPDDPESSLKRQRNNVAARKYRQKRIDRITELESEVQGVKEERDDLRLRLARQEAESAALRSMLQMKSGSSGKS